jgi:hypothetical protein
MCVEKGNNLVQQDAKVQYYNFALFPQSICMRFVRFSQ